MYFLTFLLLISTSVWVVSAEVCDRLSLSHYIKSDNADLARAKSEVDPSKFLNITSHSGFITVNEKYNSNLFFWYFPHEKPAEVPWIIWLQGGPGFSSLVGLFDLIGPVKIKDGKVAYRNVSWATDYSLLFVDSPVGAGFSYTEHDGGYPDNQDDVGAHLYELVLQFLQMFPELREAPLFIAGESYAGKYVPALAIQIHRHRDQNEEPINLRGVSIGNCLVDPVSMMHYSELCGVMGFLEGRDLVKLKELEETTVDLINEQKMVDAANKFNETIEFIKKKSGINIYNFNKDLYIPSAPDFEVFVTKPEVRCNIHVGNATFDLNNQLVYTKMLPDIMNTTKPFVEELLEHYGVLIYSGQMDVILPYGMSRYFYKELSWSRRREYDQAPRKRLRYSADKAVAAYRKSGGNFVEVLIRRAGHMVPLDQPEVAKCMLDDFIEEFK